MISRLVDRDAYLTFPENGISRWIGFLFLQNQKIERLDRLSLPRRARRCAEQQRLERERAQAVAAERARREAAIAAEAARQKARAEQPVFHEARERLQAAQHESWRRNVEHVARDAVVQQHQQALIADLERHFNPPPVTQARHTATGATMINVGS